MKKWNNFQLMNFLLRCMSLLDILNNKKELMKLINQKKLKINHNKKIYLKITIKNNNKMMIMNKIHF